MALPKPTYDAGFGRRQLAGGRAASHDHHIRCANVRHVAERPRTSQHKPMASPDLSAERRNEMGRVGLASHYLVRITEHRPRATEVQHLGARKREEPNVTRSAFHDPNDRSGGLECNHIVL